MGFLISSGLGDYDTSHMPADFGAQPGGAGVSSRFGVGGLLWSQPKAAGLAPALTAADIVVAVATIPASAFDQIGRELLIEAFGSFAANTNNKTVKLIVGPSVATVGVAITGGVTLASTGVVATNGGGWRLTASMAKLAAANTQIGAMLSGIAGAVQIGLSAPQSLTQTENAACKVALTINAATTATDALLWGFTGKWWN